MFILFYAEDSDGLWVHHQVFATHKEAYDAMRKEWDESVKNYADYLDNEEGDEECVPDEFYCTDTEAYTVEYGEFDEIRCEEKWLIIDASSKED